jgi:hypothetical protein
MVPHNQNNSWNRYKHTVELVHRLQINRHWREEGEGEEESSHVITAHARNQQRRDEHGSAQCHEVMLEAEQKGMGCARTQQTYDQRSCGENLLETADRIVY